MNSSKANRQSDFSKAIKAMDEGKHRLAFRISHRNARFGHPEFFLILGTMYSRGRGVKRSHRWTLYWYNKALKFGPPQFAASNIGSEYYMMGNFQLAEEWYLKAANLGDYDAWLQLAHLYLGPLNEKKKALKALKQVLKGTVHESVTQGSYEEAKSLLRDLK